jgi:N-acetyl-gamma-glutamyl-phosphate/LysW-gamma-L-alpha-aminoadipyl-6-phosphate reductase
MIQAAIAGGSGYAGGELLRLLTGHPEVEVTQITSESHVGQYAYFAHPNLRGYTNLRFKRLADLASCDVLFAALPHCHSMGLIGDFSQKAERVIDLSADFRLHNVADYPRWYGQEHAAPDWLPRFVYGLPELHRSDLARTRYVSGVGCNASVSLLALVPLYSRGLVRDCVVDVKVGSAEGGNKPSAASHHPERSGVVRSYSPVGHRHIAELIQELQLNRDNPALHFSVTSVGTVRGATATCHCLLRQPVTERDMWRLYRDAYTDEPFVRLVRSRRGIHRYPEAKILSGSNFCDIGFAADGEHGRMVVIAAIDNLMKGAAGSAVQSMNIMYGLDERLGLEFPGLHPV